MCNKGYCLSVRRRTAQVNSSDSIIGRIFGEGGEAARRYRRACSPRADRRAPRLSTCLHRAASPGSTSTLQSQILVPRRSVAPRLCYASRCSPTCAWFYTLTCILRSLADDCFSKAAVVCAPPCAPTSHLTFLKGYLRQQRINTSREMNYLITY